MARGYAAAGCGTGTWATAGTAQPRVMITRVRDRCDKLESLIEKKLDEPAHAIHGDLHKQELRARYGWGWHPAGPGPTEFHDPAT